MTGAPDVLVVGGGPAGCAAARLLASLGHHVVLAVNPSAAAHALPLSIPPSCRKLFDALGLTAAIDAAGFVRSTGHTVWWRRGETRVEWFAGGERGWQATAPALERVLQRAAADAGVRIESCRLDIAEAERHEATFVIDASGRAGLFAKGRSWRVPAGPRTVALVGRWHSPGGWDLPEVTQTLIEAYENGWAWSVPDSSGDRHVAVMVDPAASSLARGVAAGDVYRSEVGKTRRLAAILARAELGGRIAGWDASTYMARQVHDERTLLVGDAASFVDPLSSAGAQKALASGWLAAIAVHTALRHPQRRDVAFGFFDDREVEVFEALSLRARAFLDSAAADHPSPFWTSRAGAPAPWEAIETGVAADRDAVRRAHDQLREAPSMRLQRGPDLVIEARAAVAGLEIVLEPRLLARGVRQGLRYLHDVDLIALIDLAPTVEQVPDLYDAYQRRSGPVALPDFLTALSTAVVHGWLVPIAGAERHEANGA